ncbi:MAG: hypothetical protein R2719_02030 [Micropruina sp.]
MRRVTPPAQGLRDRLNGDLELLGVGGVQPRPQLGHHGLVPRVAAHETGLACGPAGGLDLVGGHPADQPAGEPEQACPSEAADLAGQLGVDRERLLEGQLVLRGQLREPERLVGLDAAGADRAPQNGVAGLEVDHVTDQPGRGGDRDALDRGDLQRQELTNQPAPVRTEPDRPLATDHLVLVGRRP